MPKMKAQPDWLKVGFKGSASGVGVDREKNAIMGYVVAQTGAFLEPDPRGEFDGESLRQIVKLMSAKPNGIKVRYGHPSGSGDSLGTHLGRSRNPRLGRVKVPRDGKQVELEAVRADLYFAKSAGEGNPNGNLRDYIMSLAEEDSDALASSLVLRVDQEEQLDKNGKPLLGVDGMPLPPLWRPVQIYASDLTDEGAACDGLLSAGIDVDSLPDAAVRRAHEMLDKLFASASREVIDARCTAWLQRYLDGRFGPVGPAPAAAPTPRLDALKLRLEEMALRTRRLPGRG